jgi:hypothetical protein
MCAWSTTRSPWMSVHSNGVKPLSVIVTGWFGWFPVTWICSTSGSSDGGGGGGGGGGPCRTSNGTVICSTMGGRSPSSTVHWIVSSWVPAESIPR